MIVISKLISMHRKPAIALYRILVALSVLALAVLLVSESLASRFLLS